MPGYQVIHSIDAEKGVRTSHFYQEEMPRVEKHEAGGCGEREREREREREGRNRF